MFPPELPLLISMLANLTAILANIPKIKSAFVNKMKKTRHKRKLR